MNPLNTIQGTIIAGVVLAVVIALRHDGQLSVNEQSLMMWLHVLAGITWIGLLYYFNFVQVPALAAAAKDQGGPGGAGISKYVAPRALLWFRWAAVVTWLTGAAYLCGSANSTMHSVSGSWTCRRGPRRIGVGAWLGTIMLFNVWVLHLAEPEEGARARRSHGRRDRQSAPRRDPRFARQRRCCPSRC